MGHDIIAGQFTEYDVDTIREQLSSQLHWTVEEWEHRFDSLPPFAAHLRRSAYDTYNKVIYRALNAEDLYGGSSGDGEAKSYDRIAISAARALLPMIVADSPPPIDSSLADELAAMLPRAESVEPSASSIEDEVGFLDEILAWMDQHEQDSVKVYFG